MMDTKVKNNLKISPAFNVGFGFIKSSVTITGELKFKSRVFLIPFFTFTYTEFSCL